MGLLDFFRRRGGGEPLSPDATAGGAEVVREDRAHAEHAATPGLAAEGPPSGMSDAGSLTGEDAAPPREREAD
jgi:hypothetical protein